MSQVCLVVRESDRDWSGHVHGSEADRAIAALSADPATFAELQWAMGRFARPDPHRPFLSSLAPGLRAEPFDAGLVVIDLAARFIVVESTYSSPEHLGEVEYCGGPGDGTRLRYHLAEDWRIVRTADGWVARATELRSQRKSPHDARVVLYGRPLLEFIAAETRRGTGRGDEPAEAIRKIHADWLLTPRDDLGQASPREILLEQQHHISMDLQHRSEAWSFLNCCPTALAEISQAFRYGGFGTHELVTYYGLIRHLLHDSWDYLSETGLAADATWLAAEADRLEAIREAWLDAPDPEFHGRTPRSIIRNERLRIPEAMGRGEHVGDPNCPCCQMLADMPGVGFWWLDGCNMDTDFAFDIRHRTREEWEAEQREYEEFSRKFNAEWAEKERLGVASRDGDPLWKSSYVAAGADVPLGIRLFGIGCHLAEVIASLRSSGADTSIDRLNRDFGNLREILQNHGPDRAAALIEPVLDRFAESLAEAGAANPNLAAQCELLSEEVRGLLHPADPESESGEFTEGFPF